MKKYNDPDVEMKRFWKNVKQELGFWFRPGWLSIILWGFVFASIMALIFWRAGSVRPVSVGFVIWITFSLFGILIRDGKKF